MEEEQENFDFWKLEETEEKTLLDKMLASGDLDDLSPETLDKEAAETDLKRQFSVAAVATAIAEGLLTNEQSSFDDEEIDDLKRAFYYMSRVLLTPPVGLDSLEKVDKAKFTALSSAIIATWNKGIIFALQILASCIADGTLS